MKKILLLSLLVGFASIVTAQTQISKGRVISWNQGVARGVANVKVRLSDDAQIGVSDSLGYFTSSEPLYAGDKIFGYLRGEKVFGFSWIDDVSGITSIPVGQGLDLIAEVRIRINRGGPFLEEIKPQKLQLNPSIGGGIESLVKTFIGYRQAMRCHRSSPYGVETMMKT